MNLNDARGRLRACKTGDGTLTDGDGKPVIGRASLVVTTSGILETSVSFWAIKCRI